VSWHWHRWGKWINCQRPFILYDKWTGKIVKEGVDDCQRRTCGRCGKTEERTVTGA